MNCNECLCYDTKHGWCLVYGRECGPVEKDCDMFVEAVDSTCGPDYCDID